MPSRDVAASRGAPPFGALLWNEVRRVFSFGALWCGLLLAGPAAYLTAQRAIARHAGDPLEVADVLMTSAARIELLFIPFIAAALACDPTNNFALRQLGHRSLSVVIARFLALGLVVDVLLLPALVAAALASTPAFALAGAVGVACVGLAIAGATLFVAPFFSRHGPVAAALAVIVVGGASAVVVLLELPGSFAMPSAALALFTAGLVDVRDIISLCAGALGLAFAGAALAHPTAPVEKRAVRGALILVVMLAICGAASQLRVSFDATPHKAHSLPAATASALSLVGDPVVVTVPASEWQNVQKRVLLPLGRVVKVRAKRAETQGPGPIVWSVGARTKNSFTNISANDAAFIVLDLAGLRAPSAASDKLTAPAPIDAVPLGLLLLVVVWPGLALVGLWRSRW